MFKNKNICTFVIDNHKLRTINQEHVSRVCARDPACYVFRLRGSVGVWGCNTGHGTRDVPTQGHTDNNTYMLSTNYLLY